MTSLPELDMSAFLAAPRGAAGRALRRRAARRLSRPGVLLPVAATACRPRSTPRSCAPRASSSRCPKPSGARSRSRTRRTFAATRRSAARSRKASATGASSSTSAPRSPRRASRPAIRRGCGCADRTSGPRRLPAMRGAVLDWMRAMDGVGVAMLRALALGLGQPLEHSTRRCCRAAIRTRRSSAIPLKTRARRATTKASACTTTRVSCRSCCRTTSAACRCRSATSSSTRRRSPAPTS